MRRITLLFALVTLGCGPAPAQKARPDRKPRIEQWEEPPIPLVTSVVLGDAYLDNEVAADKTYKGKTFRIQSIAQTVGKTALGAAYVELLGAKDGQAVYCYFADTKGLEDVRTHGGYVVIEGKVTGMVLGQISVKGCKLIANGNETDK